MIAPVSLAALCTVGPVLVTTSPHWSRLRLSRVSRRPMRPGHRAQPGVTWNRFEPWIPMVSWTGRASALAKCLASVIRIASSELPSGL